MSDGWIRKREDGVFEGGNDPVNHPAHYTQGGIECIDAIRAALTPEEFRGLCKGSAMQYIWRAAHKGKHNEDCAKAAWYLAKLNEKPSTLVKQ